MAWRGLHISEAARLSLSRGRLVADRDDGETLRFPLEDVAWIVLDTPQVTVSAALMAACAQSDVPVVYTDPKHLPCGVLLPFHQHWQQGAAARGQLGATAPLKKRLWQHIVRQKLANQAAVLDRGQVSGAETLRDMARHVRSGDPGNVEARAARFYWQRLFEAFRRHDDADPRNAMLDYSYAVLRAAVARALVAAGLLPAFGIHHAGAQNAFNLADDCLEVLRPLADARVFDMLGHGRRPESGGLSREARRHLAGVMTESLILDDQQLTVLPAVDALVASLVRAFEGGTSAALRLPRL